MILTKGQLTNLIAEGGEAEIYKISENHLAKIYKKTVNISEKEAKVNKLIQLNLPTCVIKPIEIITNSSGKFIGYIMPFIKNCEEIKKLSNKKFITSNGITIQDTTKVMKAIKEVVKFLHSQKIYISDFNDCNILFDKAFNPYFIDTDSWAFENFKCDVAMELFLDPLIKGNDFSEKSDSYSFAILLFKSLTRIHPFGGTLKTNDLPIIDRMKQGISLVNRLNDIIIPPTAESYKFMSPDLIKDCEIIFESSKRHLIDVTLDDFNDNLTLCKKHNNFYYKKFNTCPICDSKAIVITKIVFQGTVSGIPYRILFTQDNVAMLLSYDLFINYSGNIIERNTKAMIKQQFGYLYFYSNIFNKFVEVSQDQIILPNSVINKLHNSSIIYKNDCIWYIDPALSLNKLTLTPLGNNIKKISTVSVNAIFNFVEENSFICNTYDGIKLINVNGYNYESNEHYSTILNYGIHFDETSKYWLFITEDKRNKFRTYVFDNNKLMFYNDIIQYKGSLNNICFSNKTIYKPANGKMTAFNYEKNMYKDFDISFITEDCKLEKKGSKFIVISENVIYEIG